jgi:hypothetical protein
VSKILIFLLLGLLLQSYSLKSATVAGDPEPSAPPFWYYFTIDGLDSDKDGVRDDVEIWINNYTQEYHYNLALKQEARVQLKAFHVIDYLNAQIYLEQNRRAGNCLRFVIFSLHPEELNKNPSSQNILLKRVLNNYWRLRQYNKMGELIPRGTWDSDFKKENEEFMSCDFKLLQPEKLMKAYIKKFNKNEKLIEAIYKIYPLARYE